MGIKSKDTTTLVANNLLETLWVERIKQIYGIRR